MTSAKSNPYQALIRRHADTGSSADIAYAVLRHMIVHGDLPPGTRFRAEEQAKQMGMSRTPIREAHLRLETEGLLAVKPGAGLMVQEFSEDQVIETFYIREALEGMAARLAAENAAAHELEALRYLAADMRGAQQQEDYVLLRKLTGQFHLAVCRASRQPRLQSMIRELQDKVRRYQPTTLTNAARAADAVAELVDILRGIEARDPDAAEQAARRHRRRTLSLHIQRCRSGDAAGRLGHGADGPERTQNDWSRGEFSDVMEA